MSKKVFKQTTLFSFGNAKSYGEDFNTSRETCNNNPISSNNVSSATSTTQSSSASTLSAPIDLGDVPVQPHLKEYPLRSFKDRMRSFSFKWFSKHPWLEYSVLGDEAYCFSCRKFSSNLKETKFRTEGYSNWKKAMEAKSGFHQHETSQHHQQSMKLWMDYKNRMETSKSVMSLVSTKVMSDNQKWLQAVVRVIKFLAKHGLPVRGEYDIYAFLHNQTDKSAKDGLFFSIIKDFIFVDHPDIKEISKKLPANAKYTSPDIQNEVIDVLTNLVALKIAGSVKASSYYTVCMDGTSNKEGTEMEAVVVRFVNDSFGIEEHVISVSDSRDINAEGLFKHLKYVLDKHSLSVDGIVSQLYDGAAVMSGNRSGVQARLSEYAKRTILYVHCFNHILHLVIVSVLKKVKDVKDYFDVVENLYLFFKKSAVRNNYEGSRLKRLIETRWSGHYEAILAIHDNYDEIIAALKEASVNTKLSVSDRCVASGLLSFLNNTAFVTLTCFLRNIFTHIQMATKQLQSPHCDAASTYQVVKSCTSILQDQRTNLKSTLRDVFRECQVMSSCFDVQTEPPQKKKRSTTMPSRFNNHIVDQILPGVADDPSNQNSLMSLFGEVFDITLDELNTRFNDENFSVIVSSFSLLPRCDTFFDPVHLKPLLEYALTIPTFKNKFQSDIVTSLAAECLVFKKCVLQKFSKDRKQVTMSDMLATFKTHYFESAPVLCNLLTVAALLGYSNVSCECVFSRQKQIDSPHRQCMTPKRMGNLTLLYYESQYCDEVSFDDFAIEWRKKNRKLLI